MILILAGKHSGIQPRSLVLQSSICLRSDWLVRPSDNSQSQICPTREGPVMLDCCSVFSFGRRLRISTITVVTVKLRLEYLGSRQCESLRQSTSYDPRLDTKILWLRPKATALCAYHLPVKILLHNGERKTSTDQDITQISIHNEVRSYRHRIPVKY